MDKTYQICTRCVMDTSDPHIVFGRDGRCNHCTDWIKSRLDHQMSVAEQKTALATNIARIKEEGQGKEYDCIIGISGGTDSTYLAYLVVNQFGLRPLAVHLDNGWNSKLAVKNIKNIVRRLDIDLYTHVIDWEEFKQLQLAYLKASVIDIEVLTDHAIKAVIYEAAAQNGVGTILPGFNPDTEDILPKAWTFAKNDLVNLIDINDKYGSAEIRTFPILGSRRMRAYSKDIRQFFVYRYHPFDLTAARETISRELKWQDYGGKHYESVFTRFYQGYILPRKFGIDKRRAHFSSQILMNKLGRSEALRKLEEPTYDPEMMARDFDYVIKKFDLTKEAFEQIMTTPPRSHFDYKTSWRSKLQKKVLLPTNPGLVKMKNLITTIVKKGGHE